MAGIILGSASGTGLALVSIVFNLLRISRSNFVSPNSLSSSLSELESELRLLVSELDEVSVTVKLK